MYVISEYDGGEKVDLPDEKGCAKYDFQIATDTEVQLFSSNDGSPPTMVIPQHDMFIRDFRMCPDRVRLQNFRSDLFYTNMSFSVNIFRYNE